MMENSESGDDLGTGFLTGETHQYIVHGDADDDSEAHLAGEMSEDGGGEGGDKSIQPLREQDRFLPIANVARIMKKAIPANGKIAKDARECVQECVSEFISFITSEASDRCHQEKRKTINGEDILFAMSTLGFDNYVEPLKSYLQKYREAMKGEKVVQPNDSFEDLGDDTFAVSVSANQTLATNMLTDQNGQQEGVIYAYSSDLQQFQLT